MLVELEDQVARNKSHSKNCITKKYPSGNESISHLGKFGKSWPPKVPCYGICGRSQEGIPSHLSLKKQQPLFSNSWFTVYGQRTWNLVNCLWWIWWILIMIASRLEIPDHCNKLQWNINGQTYLRLSLLKTSLTIVLETWHRFIDVYRQIMTNHHLRTFFLHPHIETKPSCSG